MNAIHVTNHLESWERLKAGSIKQIRLELDLKPLRHSGDNPGHIIVIVLRPVRQVIQTLVSNGFQICIGRSSDV